MTDTKTATKKRFLTDNQIGIAEVQRIALKLSLCGLKISSFLYLSY